MKKKKEYNELKISNDELNEKIKELNEEIEELKKDLQQYSDELDKLYSSNSQKMTKTIGEINKEKKVSEQKRILLEKEKKRTRTKNKRYRI